MFRKFAFVWLFCHVRDPEATIMQNTSDKTALRKRVIRKSQEASLLPVIYIVLSSSLGVAILRCSYCDSGWRNRLFTFVMNWLNGTATYPFAASGMYLLSKKGGNSLGPFAPLWYGKGFVFDRRTSRYPLLAKCVHNFYRCSKVSLFFKHKENPSKPFGIRIQNGIKLLPEKIGPIAGQLRLKWTRQTTCVFLFTCSPCRFAQPFREKGSKNFNTKSWGFQVSFFTFSHASLFEDFSYSGVFCIWLSPLCLGVLHICVGNYFLRHHFVIRIMWRVITGFPVFFVCIPFTSSLPRQLNNFSLTHWQGLPLFSRCSVCGVKA